MSLQLDLLINKFYILCIRSLPKTLGENLIREDLMPLSKKDYGDYLAE